MFLGVWKRVVRCAVLVSACAAATFASPITFSGSSGNLAASARFEVSGTNLLITLTNTTANDVLLPSEVLTALFFNISGPPLNLTPVKAKLAAGSTVLFGGTDPDGVVGGEWAYRQALSGAPLNLPYGVSSAGFGLFGPANRFPGSNLQGPESPDGLQYGITSPGDNPATGNSAVTGSNALIRSAVVLKLGGIPEGFDPAVRVTQVYWQYGTSLTDPGFPEPATMGLLATGGMFYRRGGRRRAP